MPAHRFVALLTSAMRLSRSRWATVGVMLCAAAAIEANALQESKGVQIHAAAQFVRWTHPDGIYSLEIPTDWNAHPQGTRTNIGTDDGLVPTGRGGFRTVYGAILAVVDDATGSGSRSLDASCQDVFDSIVKRNAHLSVKAALASDGRLADAPAYRGVAGGISPVTGHAERAEIICRAFDDSHLMYMIMACPEAQCGELTSVFRRMRDTLSVRPAGK